MGRRRATVEELAGMTPDARFWKGRRVLLTGHTGFKGTWAAIWLARMGARVTGLALSPETNPSLWRLAGAGLLEDEIIADLRDPAVAGEAVKRGRPEIVLHMAAQSLVRRSYAQPVETFATNVMGTAYLLDALRKWDGLEAALIVTTDKVYANDDLSGGFAEADPLGGSDPYSASKACAELVTASYAISYFQGKGHIATARAGNVIGGGDWSEDRLIPDVWRAAERSEQVALRHPDATRPWQHVLEPLCGYMLYLEALAQGRTVPRALNFGPPAGESATVAAVAEIMAEALGEPALWRRDEAGGPPEMKFLSLDPSLAQAELGWSVRLSCEEAVRWSAQWYVGCRSGEDPRRLCEEQISRYVELE